MLQMLARTHYYQRLMRLGIAGFWLASQLRLNTGQRPLSPREHGHRVSVLAIRTEPSRSHVAQVLRRTWRRWWFGVRMWLNHMEYDMRETEAWLTGEISTPRSIVTSNALQVLSPELHSGAQGGLSSNGFLGYGGRWRLDGGQGGPADPSSPEMAMFEEPAQLQLPFPSVGEAVYAASPGRSREASPLHLGGSAKHDAYDGLGVEGHALRSRAKPRPVRLRRAPEDEENLAVKPSRTRRSLAFENTHAAAQESANSRYRQDEQARSAVKSWDSECFDFDFPKNSSPRSNRAEEDANYAHAKNRDAVRQQRRQPTPTTSDHSRSRPQHSAPTSEVDEMEFVEPEEAAAFDEGDGRRDSSANYFSGKARQSVAQDAAVDYWSMRSRMGPTPAARAVRLRQR